MRPKEKLGRKRRSRYSITEADADKKEENLSEESEIIDNKRQERRGERKRQRKMKGR